MGITLVEAQKQGIAPWTDLDCDLGYVKIYRDRYPVTPGHKLLIPYRNDADCITECFKMAYIIGQAMIETNECTGFNVGINIGTSSGQTVLYPHIHLIPRRDGDCSNPTGGVRNVVPGQGDYQAWPSSDR